MADLSNTNWPSASQRDEDAVLEQLEHLLAHPVFRNSKRCRALLGYIVEHRLHEGEACHLKERTLGIDVFGRNSDYDTNADPVVRTTASEIRKRIAQYYHEQGHDEEIRIELPCGSYVPEFYPPPVRQSELGVSPEFLSASPSPHLIEKGGNPWHGWPRYGIVACLLVVVGGVTAWFIPSKPTMARTAPPLKQFWEQVVTASNPVVMDIGTWPRSLQNSQSASQSVLSVTPHIRSVVTWPDLVASSKIIWFLKQSRKDYELKNSRSTVISDLTQGPVVLIGAYNNDWTLRLTDHLRFHFIRDSNSHSHWIADRENPSKRYGIRTGTIEGAMQDYAIVGRLRDGVTGQVVVIAAGIGSAATIAASDFLTHSQYMKQLAKQLPKGWESKNIEALVSVESVGNQPGAPHLDAVCAW